MANTKIGTTNYIETVGVLKNGTGGGAPALDETLPYKMENAVADNDRTVVWMTGATPGGSPVYLDVDLAGTRTLSAFGILGFRPAGASAVTTVEVFTGPTPTYPPTWTSRGTIAMSTNPRDAGLTIGAVTARFVRFAFTHTGTAWSVGRLWAGDPTDLGGVHSPGGLWSPYRNRTEQTLPSGLTMLSEIGDPGADLTLPWASVPTSMRDTLVSVCGGPGTFVMIDAEGQWFEVFAVGGRVANRRTFVSLHDTDIELRRQP